MNRRGSNQIPTPLPCKSVVAIFSLTAALLVTALAVFAPSARGADLDLIFTYSSEKKAWLESVTLEYNRLQRQSTGGRRVVVKLQPKGSGEIMDEIASDGGWKPHLVSPASGVFLELYNERAVAKGGKELVDRDKATHLVLSPVVIAMWKPMAEVLGWPGQAIGWEEVLKLARDPRGWANHSHPEWGKFKFAHTHPGYSNSGLTAMVAEVYAGAGKTRGLLPADVAKATPLVTDVERAIVHYGESTGFLADKMFANGPAYLSAAVLYENMVVESYDRARHPQNPDGYAKDRFPVVAIYPKEGTFWSDHPAGVVEREWVTAEHRSAAEEFLRFLKDEWSQARAVEFGFRRGDEKPLPPTSKLESRFGVDPRQPGVVLPVPDGETIEEILRLWSKCRKHARVALVLDISASMLTSQKLVKVQDAAVAAIGHLSDEDIVAILVFNHIPVWALEPTPVKEGRGLAIQKVNNLFASGETSLYDAIAQAYDRFEKSPSPDQISAIVVLSDGEDNRSSLTLPQIIDKVRVNGEAKNIRIFTISYQARNQPQLRKALEDIANVTQTRPYDANTKDVSKIMRELFLFFSD